MSLTFGEYLRQKRQSCNIALRKLAQILDISAPYLSDIENNRRNAPAIDKLELIADTLSLSDTEKSKLFDLAGGSHNEVAPDLPQYINQNSYVAVALRKARDLNAREEDWLKFVKELEERTGKMDNV